MNFARKNSFINCTFEYAIKDAGATWFVSNQGPLQITMQPEKT